LRVQVLAGCPKIFIAKRYHADASRAPHRQPASGLARSGKPLRSVQRVAALRPMVHVRSRFSTKWQFWKPVMHTSHARAKAAFDEQL